MTYLVTQTLNGLFSAALLFLISSGLTLVFGVMRTVNIARGSAGAAVNLIMRSASMRITR